MDGWPDIKPPNKFTGKGFEIIGDPARPFETGTLSFMDGKYVGLQFPNREILPQWTPSIAAEWSDLIQSQKRKREVDDLALRLRDDPRSKEAKDQLKAMLQRCSSESEKKAIRRAIESIRDGYAARDWPAQNPRERAAIIALVETSEEHGRPPTVPEVTDRMLTLRDSLVDMKPKLTCSERKHLTAILESLGFHWLERGKIGRPATEKKDSF